MLNGIKTLINSKIAMQESASVILENSSMMDLDDAIVLGEEGDVDLPIEEEDENDTTPVLDNEESGEDSESPEDDNKDENEDKNEPESVPGAEPEEDDDLMNHEIDSTEPNKDDNDNDGSDNSIDTSDPMNDEIEDTLPEPIGKQTGEPVADDDNDLMNMEIDLSSNTMSGILPVPPSNASDAVVSDEMSTSVESGFEGDNPVAESAANSDKNKGNKWDNKILNSLCKVMTCFTDDPKYLKLLQDAWDDLAKFNDEHKEVFNDNHMDDKDIRLYHSSDAIWMVINILEYGHFVHTVDWKAGKDDFMFAIDNIIKGTWLNPEVKKDDISDADVNQMAYEFNKKAKNGINVYAIHTDGDSYTLCLCKKKKAGAINKILKSLKSELCSASRSKDGKYVFESTDVFAEGISLAGGMEGDATTDSTGDPAPADSAAGGTSDTPPDTNNTENEVTSAVRDKVNESETTDNPEAIPSETPTDGENNGSTMSKEEIFTRLSKLTGDIEGLKSKLVVGK